MHDIEYETLRKYRKGRIIDGERDLAILEDWANVKFVSFGVTTQDDNPRETAKLTEIGDRIVARERISRSRVLTFLYDLSNSLW